MVASRSAYGSFASGFRMSLAIVSAIGFANVHAESTYMTSALIQGPPQGTGGPDQVLRISEHTGAPSVANFDGDNRDGYVDASLGTLRLSAYAQKEWSIEAYAYVTDEFIVSSPIGTTALLNFAVEVSGTVRRNSQDYAFAYMGASAGLPIKSASVEVSLGRNDPVNTSIFATDTRSYEVAVGTPFQVDYSAGLSVMSHRPGATVSADFLSTVHVYAWATDEAVTIITASGYDYSPPAAIPEPSSGLMALAGLLTLAGLRQGHAWIKGDI